MTAVVPVRVVELGALEGYVSEGVVDVRLYLTNMRADYDFVLFSDSRAASAFFSLVSSVSPVHVRAMTMCVVSRL